MVFNEMNTTINELLDNTETLKSSNFLGKIGYENTKLNYTVDISETSEITGTVLIDFPYQIVYVRAKMTLFLAFFCTCKYDKKFQKFNSPENRIF